MVDGSDNFPTRYLVNDACVLTGRPYVYGSIFRFEGQAAVFAAPGGPCYRCLYPEPPPPDLVPTCAEGGVLGVLPGMIGTIQANEAIKLILGIGEPLVGRLLLLDALRMRFREVRLPRDPDCPVCGDHPTIRELQDYEAFCGMPHTAGPAQGGREDAPGFDITPVELKAAIDSGSAPLLLDVREPMEFRINQLPGAVLVPLGAAAATRSRSSTRPATTSSTATTASAASGRSSSSGPPGSGPATWPAASRRGSTRSSRDDQVLTLSGSGLGLAQARSGLGLGLRGRVCSSQA